MPASRKSGNTRSGASSAGKNKQAAKRRTTAGSARPAVRSSAQKRSSGRKTTHRKGLAHPEYVIAAAFAVAVLLLLADFGMLGKLGPYLKAFQCGLFGYLGYAFPVCGFIAVWFCLSNPGNREVYKRLAGGFLVVFALCGLLELFFPGQLPSPFTFKDIWKTSAAPAGGGVVGGISVKLLAMTLGDLGMSVIMLLLVFFGLLLVTGWSLKDFFTYRSEPAGKAPKTERENVREREALRRQEAAEARLRMRDARRQEAHEEKMLRQREKADQINARAEYVRQKQNDLPDIQERVDAIAREEDQGATFHGPSLFVHRPEDAAKAAATAGPRKAADEPPVALSIDVVDTEAMRKRPKTDRPITWTFTDLPVFDGSQAPSAGPDTSEKPARTRKAADRPKSSKPEAEAASPAETPASRRVKPADIPIFFGTGSQAAQPSEEIPAPEKPAAPAPKKPAARAEKKPAAAPAARPAPAPDNDIDNLLQAFSEEDTEPVTLFQEDDPYEQAFDDEFDEPGIPEQFLPGYDEKEAAGKDLNTYNAETGVKRVVTASGKVIEVELDGVPGARKMPPAPPKKETVKPEEIVPVKPVILKDYVPPKLNLLKLADNNINRQALDAELRDTAVKLQETLQSFGVGVTVANVTCGPTVTRYELQPEHGVKVSRITSLADDIKLSLAAADIRIEAPVPGKSVIGIEVPNRENVTVSLRELLETPEFKNHPSKLAFAVGKDIGGKTIIGDIARMPHLLIAGATGSGKSVCINTLIISLLYRAKPDEVKLIMIDPKVIELQDYNGIPHLLLPVITDPKKAAGALNWAVAEMTQRYKKFADVSVRNIGEYNRKIDDMDDLPEEKRPEKMPYIVIIVDELADLMMTCGGEVEDAIIRLAQLARACGIHLVIATQRPSVNVITGLIKANIPSRIAFAVTSGVDSRTILDHNGAEKLLGKGDMLYSPMGMNTPLRVQGAFVSGSEVTAVVESITKQGAVKGSEQNTAITESASSNARGGAADRDELFMQAAQFIVDKEKASIGALQRMFSIGFNRAARIMDQLCDAGVVSEEEGTKPRRVLLTKEQFAAWQEENF